MFCVIYQWKAKAGCEKDFRETWRGITEAIFHQHGSLGSRLHRSEAGDFVAYAQWPDRHHWENHAETLGVELLRLQQSNCLIDQVQILFKLEVTDDLLQAQPFAGSASLRPTDQIKLRVARPTDQLENLLPFYRDGLGLKILSRFKNHDGFDGIMLGGENSSYHLEFTSCRGHAAGKAPTQDNLLIFYLPDHQDWTVAVERMVSHGYNPVASFNPYWDEHGLTFEDPDNYRVVLQNECSRFS